MKTLPVLLLGVGLAFAGNASAEHHGHRGLEACLSKVKAVQPGAILKVEHLSLTDEGKAAYEIEVRDRADRVWEFECSQRGAELLEIERVVEANDPLFTSKAKVSLNDATATVTALYPGEVREVQHELEADGTPVYEIDVASDNGTEFKVEVSAVTGEIVEVQIESWQIGDEDRAR